MQINLSPHRLYLKQIRSTSEWDFSNDILYRMCSNYPNHERIDHIIAKVLIIGRSYSASIERRKKKMVTGISDDFYVETVGPQILRANFDSKIAQLTAFRRLTFDSILTVLEVHRHVADTFYRISGLQKRSLASKYLHFHKPELFAMFDSRAVAALTQFISRVPKDYKHILSTIPVDLPYAKFTIKALILKNAIEDAVGRITMRQFDSFLLGLTNASERTQKLNNAQKSA